MEQGENVLSVSGEDTLSRLDRRFRQGYCKVITSQLGYSHYYDNTVTNTDKFMPSALIDKKEPIKRPQKALVLEDMVPATLSMKPFIYDALLTKGDEYKQFILDDIKRVYKAMLDCDATSFWEVEGGWDVYDKAGSLCHGWSASPVYYLNILSCE